MNQSKMLALKPEGSQHALSAAVHFQQPSSIWFSPGGIRLPIVSRHSLPASKTKLTYHSSYRPPLWQIKTNDHEGESLPQPELWTGIAPVLTVTITNTQISSHVAYSGELRKISVRPNRIDLCSCHGAKRPEPETFR